MIGGDFIMTKIKEFIKDRNIFLLISSIINLFMFIVCIGLFIEYAKDTNEIRNIVSNVADPSQTIDRITLAYNIFSMTINEATMFYSILLSFISIFTIVGYIYKENSFILVSTFINLICLFLGFKIFNLTITTISLVLFILNILGLITQKKKITVK